MKHGQHWQSGGYGKPGMSGNASTRKTGKTGAAVVRKGGPTKGSGSPSGTGIAGVSAGSRPKCGPEGK